MSSTSGILGGIGNTPLVALARVAPGGAARVVAKLEWANPSGSMKDRMALAMIEGAEARGLLAPGGTVVLYTAGAAGISLALVCAARGLPLEVVYSDAFSRDKRRTMEAFGARVTDVPSDGGKITEALVREMIRVAGEIGRRPGHWHCDQLANPDAAGGYRSLGEELWRQAEGRLDAFVHCVSTAHSIHGVTDALWSRDPRVRIVAVEPAESAVLSGGPSGSHRIEGIGIGFVPPHWRPDRVNRIERVATEEAREMARRLAREEGIFAGVSSGANVVAALRVARELGPEATVATLIVDSGAQYASTDLYAGRPGSRP